MNPYGASAQGWRTDADGADNLQRSRSAGSAESASSGLPAENVLKQQNHAMLACGDVKPRLTKEQHDILEAHFQQQNKPSTSTKKGFADSLGVPLDKINNWFQNRRAKVKQDLKKQMSASNMFYANLPLHTQYLSPSFDQYPSASASTGQDLYPPHSAPSMFGLPTDTLESHSPNNAVSAQMHMQQNFGGPLQSISESSQPGSYDGILHSLVAAGYDMQPMNMGSIDLSGNFVNVSQPTHSENYLDDTQYPLTLDFTGMIEPESMNGTLADNSFTYQSLVPSTSALAQTLDSNGSLSSEQSTSSSQHSFSTLPSTTSTNTIQSVDPTYPSWNEEKHSPTDVTPDTLHMGSAGSTQPSNPYALQGTVGNQWNPLQSETFMQFTQQPSTFPEANQPTPTLTSSVSPPGQVDSKPAQHTFPDAEQPGVLPSEAFSRRASSTTALTESMSHVGIQTPRASVDANFKQPSQPSSIAVRRQRPRPAALGTTGLRSVSYSAGMPSPPNASQSLNPDHNLRRIRSTGIQNGLTNGRIQKPSPASAQRSPLTFTFAEAAASPKFARHNSLAAVTSPGVPISADSLAPPTPLTPHEFARFPSWQSHTVKTHTTTLEHANSESRVWPRDLSVPVPQAHVTSPPSTPMNSEPLLQYRPQIQSTPIYRDTPPQSAPATQQSFPRTPFMPQTQPILDTHGVADYPNVMNRDQRSRRPSLPDSAVGLGSQDQMQWGFPMFNAAGELQLDYSMQLKQPTMGAMPHQQHTPPQQVARAFALPSSIEPQKSLVMPDFFVHEYSPPQAASQKSSPLRLQENQPKNYTFDNKGPRNFESP